MDNQIQAKLLLQNISSLVKEKYILNQFKTNELMTLTITLLIFSLTICLYQLRMLVLDKSSLSSRMYVISFLFGLIKNMAPRHATLRQLLLLLNISYMS